MRKLIKFILLFCFTIIALIISKNLFLYSTYNHDDRGLKKVSGPNREIAGTWELYFDTFEHMIDTKQKWTLILSEDSTGNFYYKSFHSKIFGGHARVYSWRSLLPYKKKEDFYFDSKVVLDDEYLIFFPDSNSAWGDTLYAKYSLKNDSLLIDRHKRNKRYSDPPDWGFYYSFKPKLYSMFEFWYF